jgi:UDP-N-acetylmuramate dehydrogenase
METHPAADAKAGLLLARLRDAGFGERAVPDALMSQFTSFRIGGPADVLVDAASPGDIATALDLARELGVPHHVIGMGTNLLVLDGGIRGLVVRIGPRLNSLTWDDAAVTVTAGAGIAVAKLAARAADRGWSGLEWAEGVPGTLGGAVYMNAGAYGGEMSQSVEWVQVLERGGQLQQWPAAALEFAYRSSRLQRTDVVVTGAKLRLSPGDPRAIRARMADFAHRRRERQPLEYPSAGSFFVRPAGRYVGPMIEECGLKGLRRGGAEVSWKHANFIINVGGATAADVLALAAEVRRAVQERHGVLLEPEVRIIGEPGGAPPASPADAGELSQRGGGRS